MKISSTHLCFQLAHFTDGAGYIGLAHGVIFASEHGNTNEGVADDSSHIVK